MPRSRPLSLANDSKKLGALVVSLITGLGLTLAPAAFAQVGGRLGPRPLQRPGTVPAQKVKIKSPVPFQVIQRNANDCAEIPIILEDSDKDAKVVNVTGLSGPDLKFKDGTLTGVPVGGPYNLNLTIKKGDATVTESIGPVFVGDLWVLAGQSNMEGVGDLIDVTPPNPQVMCLGMDGNGPAPRSRCTGWSIRPTRSTRAIPRTRAERSAQQHKTRTKGAGLGLPFAVAMVEQTRRPDRPGRTRPRRHEHGAVEPGQEGRGGQQPLRLVAPPGQAGRRQGQGRALVPGRERRDAGGVEDLRPGLRRLHRRGPRRPRPARAAVLLRPDRPVRHRATIPRAGTPCRTPSGGCPSACPTRPSSR